MKPDENTASGRFETIISRLQAAGVEFIIVGDQAETLHGSPRVTYDTDLCCRRTPENIERLATALKEFHPTLRGAPKELRVPLDARMLRSGQTSRWIQISGRSICSGIWSRSGNTTRFCPAQNGSSLMGRA